jgi:hypothetical protein
MYVRNGYRQSPATAENSYGISSSSDMIILILGRLGFMIFFIKWEQV